MVFTRIRGNGGEILTLRTFSVDKMVPNPSICMIAKRGSGKSWVVRAILKRYSHIPGTVIIAPTENKSVFYANFIPETYIHYKYTPELMDNILYRQDRIIEKTKEKIKQHKKIDPRSILVMDDCLSSKGTWLKDESMHQVLFDGRHFRLMYILTMQFPLGISPELRNNFDYVFLLADNFESNRKRIYNHYAGMFESYNDFRDAFSKLTNDHGCMVLNNRTGGSQEIIDCVFYYKASEETLDAFGSKQYNRYHKHNYNPKWKDKIREKDIVIREGNGIIIEKNNQQF